MVTWDITSLVLESYFHFLQSFWAKVCERDYSYYNPTSKIRKYPNTLLHRWLDLPTEWNTGKPSCSFVLSELNWSGSRRGNLGGHRYQIQTWLNGIGCCKIIYYYYYYSGSFSEFCKWLNMSYFNNCSSNILALVISA